MADIRINQLPVENSPVATEVVPIDGATTRKATIQSIVDVGSPIASQAEAEGGTQATKRMTPLTTKQAIDHFAATAAQGALADSALQPGEAATPAQGALATTAMQPGAFGLGTPLNPTTLSNLDDQTITTGFYRTTTAGTTGTFPVAAADATVLIERGSAAGWVKQTLTYKPENATSPGRTYIRTYNQTSGVWATWRRLAQTTDTSLWFSNVAAMVAGGSSLSIGQVVETRGYFSDGDGGGNKYVIVAAGTGTADGGSFINITGGLYQAKGLFNGTEIAAEKFGCIDNLECAAALQAANNYALSLAETLMTDPYTARKQLRLTLAQNIKIKNKLTLGQSGRALDINFSGALLVCVSGGNLVATDPAVTLIGDNSTRHLCRINANKLSSGWLINGRNSYTYAPTCIRFHGTGFGVKVNDSRGSSIYNPWAWEYAPGDAGAGVAANYTGKGLVYDGFDFTVFGGHPGWCGVAIHITENAGFLELIQPHPYCNKPDNAETDPRIDPIAILNDSPNRNWITQPYVDGGYVVDNTATLQIDGGFHYMSDTALPGVSTPYTRIKNVLGSLDKLANFRGFQSSFGVFETTYTGPDISVWNSLSGAISRPSANLNKQVQDLYSGNLGTSPHRIEAHITGGNVRKRTILAGGKYLQEENGLFSGVVTRKLTAEESRIDSTDIGGTSTAFLLGPNYTGFRANHSNGRLEALVSDTTSKWHWTTTGAYRPSVDGTYDIGSSDFRVSTGWVSSVVQAPGIGVTKTPANNGDLVMDIVSNTSVRIRLKGSDGTVRSATLTLT